MITGLLNLVYYFLNFLINLFPQGGGFPSEVHDAFATLGSYFGIIDVFVPISLITFSLATVFGVEIAIFGFKTLKWIISHIPWIGGKGNHA